MKATHLQWPSLLLLGSVGASAVLSCRSSSHDNGTGGACQTPAGQAADWYPPNSQDSQDAGLPPLGSPMGGVSPEGGLDYDGGGGAMRQADGGSDGGVVTDQQADDESGTNLTYFFNQLQQFAIEPAAQSALDKPFPNTNGRFCETCHDPHQGWQLDPIKVSSLFDNGPPNGPSNATASSNDQLDPLFRTVDGATSPNADVSTPASRTAAYALLLKKGLIRVGRPMPDGAEFSLAAAKDPYGFASASELSLFRRPLPVMNVRFLTTVMWDARYTVPCQTLISDLGSQADDANRKHAQATGPLTDTDKQTITDRERTIYFAQNADRVAGPLDQDGALGGPMNLQQQPFYFGMNAFPGPDPKGVAFNAKAFTLFDAWARLSGSDARTAARQAIARGQALFNSRTFTIANVKGFNDDLGKGSVQGTCTTCHNAPNVGNNSVGLLMDIGVSDASRRTPDLPLYTFKNNATGDTVQVTDPGRGLITGAWKDIGRFKVPSLRGLAALAPYFHDGSAATVMDVINFNDARFGIGLTDADKRDLAAFLNAL